MRQTNTRPSKTRNSQPRAQRRAERAASFRRRLAALGLADADPPKDMDEFRVALARRIHMYINDWPGCPERLCRRQRGCFAPSGACSNYKPARPLTPEQDARMRAAVGRAVKQALAQREQG